MSIAKTASYLGLWYFLNILYNLSNKSIATAFPLPLTLASAQLFAGLLYIVPCWALGVRPVPTLGNEDLKRVAKVALFHTVGHCLTVLSLSAGSVSFTHIIKSAEPIFSTLLLSLLGTRSPLPVNLMLFPIVFGVCLASMTELSFTWPSFWGAMGSNLSFAVRAIFSKRLMSDPPGKDLTPANLFAVLTIISALLTAPVVLVLEGPQIMPALEAAYDSFEGGKSAFLTTLLTSGLTYYMYNETAYLALSLFSTPTTHAVANTVKRVVILVTSTVYFKTEMSGQSVLGCAIAVGGVLGYSVVKGKYANKKKAA